MIEAEVCRQMSEITTCNSRRPRLRMRSTARSRSLRSAQEERLQHRYSTWELEIVLSSKSQCIYRSMHSIAASGSVCPAAHQAANRTCRCLAHPCCRPCTMSPILPYLSCRPEACSLVLLVHWWPEAHTSAMMAALMQQAAECRRLPANECALGRHQNLQRCHCADELMLCRCYHAAFQAQLAAANAGLCHTDGIPPAWPPGPWLDRHRLERCN